MANELNILIRDGLYRSGKAIWGLPLENILRLGGLFIVAITALGLPAVVLQFYRLNIPINFLSRTEALRGGILPTILLSVILSYLYWCAEQVSREAASPARVIFAILPFFTALLLVTIGYLSFMVAFLWFIFTHERNIAVERWTTWPILIAGALFWVLSNLFRSKWAHDRFAIVQQLESMPTRIKERLEKWFSKDRLLRKSNVTFVAVIAAFFGGFLVVYGGFGGLKFAIHPHITAFKSPVIVYVGLVSGCLAVFLLLVGVFFGQLESSEDQQIHLRSAVTLTLAVLFFYVPSAVLYALVLYPRIPYSLGGGKPTPVTIFLEEAHLPDGWRVEVAGKQSKLTNIYLLQYDSERYIITATDAPDAKEAVVLPTDTLKLLISVAR